MKQTDTVIFDLDDVVVKDSYLEFLKEFMKNHGITLLKTEVEEAKRKYYIEREIIKTEWLLDEFHKTLLDIDIYDYGVLDKDAINLIRRISDVSKVFIATTPLMSAYEKESGILYQRKYNFLVKIFPFLDPKNFILGGNKSILNAKYFIDDKLENLDGDSQVKILYTADHNKEYGFDFLYEKGIIRIDNMKELEKCIFAEYTMNEMREIIRYTLYNVLKKGDIYVSHTAYTNKEREKKVNIYISELESEPDFLKLELYLEKLLGQEVEIKYNK